MTCELCLAFPHGGEYNFNNECCLNRYYANAPRHIRRAEYSGIVASQGKEAAEAWAVKVKAEMERIKR